MAGTKVDPSQLDEAAITDIKTDGSPVKPDTKHINFQSPLGAAADGDGVNVSIGSIEGLPGAAGDAQVPASHGNDKHTPAMLENAADTFTIFDEKTTPHDDDIVLMEDSENSYNKKKVKTSNIGGIFGTDYQYEEDEDEDTTESTSYQPKLKLQFTPPVAGNYLITWTAEITNSATNRYTSMKVELDDTIILNEIDYEPESANSYDIKTSFKKINLTAASHDIDIDFKTSNAAGTAKIRRARLTAWRIP